MGGIDGRFHQRVSEMAAANRWRNFCVHQHERLRRAFVDEDPRVPVDRELEPTRLPVVGD
jgi:hypothetical protein